ncbi:MAG: beta strand repeat-containing protein, partial [Bacteroidota bacterium]
NALNQIVYGCSGPVTLTIKPQTTATLTGSVASGALIKLNGADNVIIDGSNSGGTDRSLTITNTATTAPTVIWLSSLGAGAGATNNTVKNCVINATAATTATAYGISVSGATIGSAGADNDNITIQNNLITSTNIGVYANGSAAVSAGGLDNLNISGNTFNSVAASTLATLTGIQIGNALGSVVSFNTLSLIYAAAGQPVAISLETGVSGAQVTRNNITQVTTTNTVGYGGRGITVGTGSATSNITIANNNISGVNGSNFSSFSNSSSMGIAIGVLGNTGTLTTVAGGINLYNNSVNMYGAYSYAASCLTTALYVGSGASALDIRNNIFVNSMNNTNSSGTASKNYAFYSAAANTAFANINYNDYHVSGTQGVLGFLSSDRTTMAALRTATGQDVNSLSSPPSFVSSTDLHLGSTGNDCLDKRGTPITAVTTDFDGDTRNASTPDIGMDEFTSTTDFSIQVAETSELSNNDGRVCSGASAVLTASNGSAYLWSTGASTAAATVNPASETTYTVTITLVGCSVTSSYTVTTTALPVPSTTFTETSGSAVNDGIICVGGSATVTAAGGNGFLWSNGNSTSSISVSPTTTTTYTVTVTDANNCTATSAPVVNVNAIPVAAIAFTETSGINSNDGTICSGSSVSLNASGGTSYVWSTGDNTSAATVSPTATTTYTVTVTDANACVTNTSATVSVNALPTPSVSFTDGSGNTGNDGVICLGDQATLTVSGSGTYLWETSETTQSVTVSPTTTTSYAVTFTDTNNCSAVANATVTVNG